MASFAQTPAITATDILLLTGKWKGSLTYLDYTSKKSFTMPAAVTIGHLPKTNALVFSNNYPNEPKANDIDTVTVSKNGRMVDQEKVRKRTVLPNGNIEIVTEYTGTDGNDNQPSLIRHTYTLGKRVFKKSKEVQFKGQSIWIQRHEYSYTKE